MYTCRFFPSGVVVLSGGADTQLKIWSAETGQCAATLIGHTAGIARVTDNSSYWLIRCIVIHGNSFQRYALLSAM